MKIFCETCSDKGACLSVLAWPCSSDWGLPCTTHPVSAPRHMPRGNTSPEDHLQLATCKTPEQPDPSAVCRCICHVTANKGSAKDPQGAGPRDNWHPAGQPAQGSCFWGAGGGCCSCGEEGRSWNACRRDENATPFCVQGLRYNTVKLTTGREAKWNFFSHKCFGEGGGKIMFLGKAWELRRVAL